MTVVHHGVPDPFGELPQAERERMALTVGIVDRRNVAAQGARGRSCEAAALLPDVEFVLAGRWDDGAADELREAATPNVTLTGWVEQDVLNDYYRRASVYVQASVARGLRPLGRGRDAGRLHPGHDARGRAARGRRRRRHPGRRAGPGAAGGRDRAGARQRRRRARRAARERVLRHFPLEIRREGVQALVAETLDRHPDARR